MITTHSCTARGVTVRWPLVGHTLRLINRGRAFFAPLRFQNIEDFPPKWHPPIQQSAVHITGRWIWAGGICTVILRRDLGPSPTLSGGVENPCRVAPVLRTRLPNWSDPNDQIPGSTRAPSCTKTSRCERMCRCGICSWLESFEVILSEHWLITSRSTVVGDIYGYIYCKFAS